MSDFSTEQDYLSYVDAMDSSNFIGGYTATDHALQMAYEDLLNSGHADENYLVLITSGAPSSYAIPAEFDGGFVTGSQTFQNLQDFGVSFRVGIASSADTTQQQIDSFYLPMVSDAEHVFAITDEDALDIVNFGPAAVPEPSTYAAILVSSVFTITLLRRRRRA